MIKARVIGKWRDLRLLLRNYDKRVSYSIGLLSLDSANFLLKEIKDRSPNGPDFDVYRDSLKVVKVGNKHATYAVVSDRDKVGIGNIGDSDENFGVVVYIVSTGGTVGKSATLAGLIAQNEIWTADLIPHGIKKSSVSMVHRRVIKSEESYIRQQTREFIAENKSDLVALGAHWGAPLNKRADRGNLTSLPDYMTLALRAEFGINNRSQPHWRPSIEVLRGSIQKLIEKNQDIYDALHDCRFTDHMKTRAEREKWEGRRFKREADQFQRALGG